MLAGMEPDGWNLRARVPRAAKYIQGLSISDTADVIWGRIEGRWDPALPKFERFERPADIFIDVVLSGGKEYPTASGNIRCGVAELIKRLSIKPQLDSPDLIAEALFLAARIESKSAIPWVKGIADHPDSDRKIDRREALRSRALRALFGLLISLPDERSSIYQDLFLKYSTISEYTTICAAALIKLFKSDQDVLLVDLQTRGVIVNKRNLALQLEAAGE